MVEIEAATDIFESSSMGEAPGIELCAALESLVVSPDTRRLDRSVRALPGDASLVQHRRWRRAGCHAATVLERCKRSIVVWLLAATCSITGGRVLTHRNPQRLWVAPIRAGWQRFVFEGQLPIAGSFRTSPHPDVLVDYAGDEQSLPLGAEFYSRSRLGRRHLFGKVLWMG